MEKCGKWRWIKHWTSSFSITLPETNSKSTWNTGVRRWVSFWKGLLPGAMLVMCRLVEEIQPTKWYCNPFSYVHIRRLFDLIPPRGKLSTDNWMKNMLCIKPETSFNTQKMGGTHHLPLTTSTFTWFLRTLMSSKKSLSRLQPVHGSEVQKTKQRFFLVIYRNPVENNG